MIKHSVDRKGCSPSSNPGKIGVFHLSLNPCGGAERLALTFSAALRKVGYSVDLITTEKPQWASIQRKIDLPPQIFEREIVIPPFRRLPTIYAIFAYWLCRDVILTPFLRHNYDFTVTTIQTLPIVFSDILYIHDPHFDLRDLDTYTPKYSSGIMRAYSYPCRLLTALLVNWGKIFHQKPVLVTNSNYTRKEIREHLETDALVIYPPVNVDDYLAVGRTSEKENIVLTISRLDEAKNLALIPEIARKTRIPKFVILGASDASKEYVPRIVHEAKTFGVEDRIEIIENASERTKKEYLCRAKIYLHTMVNEPFGMSIVEAMAAGLVPVVHQSGGPWMDILDERQGTYGYSYTSTEQAANMISKLLSEEQERLEVAARAIQRSKLFDTNKFVSAILRLVRARINARMAPRR